MTDFEHAAEIQAKEIDDAVRPTADAFREFLNGLPDDEHRLHALEILWDDICPDCGGGEDSEGKSPRPCNCVGHRKKAEVNAEAALHWALDMLDRCDTRLVRLGDDPELVSSPTHQAGKTMARQALDDLAVFSGCCHAGDGHPVNVRRSEFVPGFALKTRGRTLVVAHGASDAK